MNHRIFSLLPLLLTLAFFSAFAQEPIWTEQMTVSELLALEKRLNPNLTVKERNISLSVESYPLIDRYKVNRPLCIERPAFRYLPLNVEFFYTPADSIVRTVTYDWEIGKFANYFTKVEMWKEENKKIELYRMEFKRISEQLDTLLGKPSYADEDEGYQDSDSGGYVTRTVTWDMEDYFAELNLIFASNTHRIRLSYYWK